MLSRYIKSCRIVCFSDEDKHLVALEDSGVSFDACGEWDKLDADSVPTLLIGWSNVKSIYPDQNILIHQIEQNVFWTYSNSEDSVAFKKNVGEFLKHSTESFLTISYESYDAIIDGDFKTFVSAHILKSKNVFVYFYGGCLYAFDGFSEFGLNLESMRYCGMPIKELITWFLYEFKCIVLNYSNIKHYVKSDFLKNYISVENAMWAKFSETFSENDMFKIFEGTDCRKHVPFFMSMLPIADLSDDETKSCIRHCTKDAVSNWLSERRIYFDDNFTNNRLKLIEEGKRKYTTLKYSTKTTLTGRMHCVEGSFNPQNLSKDSEYRKNIISRFDGGKISVFDYVSFETRIATYMSGDNDFISKYKDKDMHAEVAKIALGWNGIDENIRNIAKNANHALLYGGGEETIEALLVGIENPKVALIKIKEFLNPLLEIANEIALSYDELGYIINPFGTLIRSRKRWGTFSNYVSSTASDIVAEKILQISSFTENLKSQFIFQVHDSFIFDIHPDEEYIIPEITKMLSIHKNLVFQIETITGANLFECGHTKSTTQ